MPCGSWQELWLIHFIVWQVILAMIWGIRVVHKVTRNLVVNVDHPVQQSTLRSVTEHVLLSLSDPLRVFPPAFLVPASPGTYPHAIVQAEKSLDDVFDSFWLPVSLAVQDTVPDWLDAVTGFRL